MIANDFNSFPEFREGFFRLIQSIITYCTGALLQMEGGAFETLVQAILFGCKHERTEIMDLSLQILDDLLKKMSSEPQICTHFF
jgi:hypothetical protein